ncbi:MAG: cupin domain-containing protein [Christensenellales bacterium]|jgi:oxalate decarboxylase/phosphoglucose isomerase-like protein (cupin superfamily)
MGDVYSFDPAAAHSAHEDTILAAPVLPEDFAAPFDHAWGYLKGRGMMDAHRHPDKNEFYVFTQGEGFAILDGAKHPVKAGSIVLVRENVLHSVANETDAPLCWAAFWWKNPTRK